MTTNLPATIENNVKERIKAALGDLIPDEVWDRVVRSTVAEFLEKDLPAQIKTALAEQFKQAIAAEFAKPEWQTQWNSSGRSMASDAVKEIAIKAAPEILANMIGPAIQQTIYTLQSQAAGYRL